MPKTLEKQHSVTNSVEKVKQCLLVSYISWSNVLQVIFLQKRELNFITATLVTCGANGLVQFWNIYGGGLRGEFNVFEHGSELVGSIKQEDLQLHSVTACAVDSYECILITGNTLGYIQVHTPSNYHI